MMSIFCQVQGQCQQAFRPLTHAPETGAIGLNSTPDIPAASCVTSNVIDCLHWVSESGIEFMAPISRACVRGLTFTWWSSGSKRGRCSAGTSGRYECSHFSSLQQLLLCMYVIIYHVTWLIMLAMFDVQQQHTNQVSHWDKLKCENMAACLLL